MRLILIKMKIKVEKFRDVVYHAYCQDCNWDAAIHSDEEPERKDVRNAIRRHVNSTGHKVDLESGSSIQYSPEETKK